MRITIAERLKPFCHLPGTACIVPWSSWKVRLFPTLLKFEDMMSEKRGEYQLGWKGPVLDFTVELDLEKGVVFVYGHTAEGYRRASIFSAAEGLTLSLEKEKKKVVLATGKAMPHRPLERLSLGSHKALDWELVARRRDLSEIFPVWNHLGQMVPEGERCDLFQTYDKLAVEVAYLKWFLVGFEKMMVPRCSDPDHQGITQEGNFCSSPLALLAEGRGSIRALFFKESGTNWDFLASLAPHFHAGRFLNVQTKNGDCLDFEWSKKLLRRLVIRPCSSREILVSLQKPLTSFRLRRSPKDRGVRWESKHPLKLEDDKTLYLDRFEK